MGSAGGAFAGSVMNGDRSIRLDFRAQDWYTRANRANVKPLILLILLKRRGNPSLSATLKQLKVGTGWSRAVSSRIRKTTRNGGQFRIDVDEAYQGAQDDLGRGGNIAGRITIFEGSL